METKRRRDWRPPDGPGLAVEETEDGEFIVLFFAPGDDVPERAVTLSRGEAQRFARFIRPRRNRR